jgi:hypothetical protein
MFELAFGGVDNKREGLSRSHGISATVGASAIMPIVPPSFVKIAGSHTYSDADGLYQAAIMMERTKLLIAPHGHHR